MATNAIQYLTSDLAHYDIQSRVRLLGMSVFYMKEGKKNYGPANPFPFLGTVIYPLPAF